MIEVAHGCGCRIGYPGLDRMQDAMAARETSERTAEGRETERPGAFPGMAVDARFGAADIDGDGSLSKEEYSRHLAERREERSPEGPPAERGIRAILEGILSEIQALKAGDAPDAQDATTAEGADTEPAADAPETASGASVEKAPGVGEATDAVEADAAEQADGVSGAATGDGTAQIAATDPVARQFETLVGLLDEASETGRFAVGLPDLARSLYVDVQEILSSTA